MQRQSLTRNNNYSVFLKVKWIHLDILIQNLHYEIIDESKTDFFRFGDNHPDVLSVEYVYSSFVLEAQQHMSWSAEIHFQLFGLVSLFDSLNRTF